MGLLRVTVCWLLVAIFAAGCARRDERPPKLAEQAAPVNSPPVTRKVVFQMDWFPQAEQGGFYQALAKGFYSEVGLNVDMRPGGPGVAIKIPVAKGDADFGIYRSDDVMLAAGRGLPLMMIAATFQHDPQALMVHDGSPVKSFEDLQGRTVTAALGMAWIPYIQKKYGIKFDLKPLNYGLAGFLADKTTVQQCFMTNEPFYVQQRGLKVRTLALADSGYDIYQTIICRRELARTQPELVRAFVAASVRGWRDYLDGDPTPAHAVILERNSQTTREQLEFSRGQMIAHSLIKGDRTQGEDIGQLSLERIAREMAVLVDLKIMDAPVPLASIATREFLPPPAR